ncbi:beta-lactamase superfamily domain-containing [Trichoderma arundinaceum]|uniref:Beta-lactamase superfamily domain-containing n=1 Tax=Trichoderma arundinaceum TaxID=490622 RepID=A0A395NJ52_TRIAR|nr:beta-lactamase superfamily domain-containing [Trichoderma arundinaceum]
MALKISNTASGDSFLLTFTPLGGKIREPFNVLLNPAPEEPMLNCLRSLPYSPSRHSQLVYSPRYLPEPDLVIITQSRNNHSLEATLRQIAPTTTKTAILAEPSVAKTIRGWKHFADGIVKTLYPWQDPRQKGKDRVVRLPVPPCYAGGENGELTVSFVPQKRDVKGTHAAIGITYRPPPLKPSLFRRHVSTPPETPPQLPAPLPAPSMGTLTARLVPPTPPDTPVLAQLPQRTKEPALPLPLPYIQGQTLSVIFSPRGTPYSSIKPYATSHLVAEAALPLTALIHSFDAEYIPWWALGQGTSHLPIGQETALALGARAWVGARSQRSEAAARSRRSRRRTFLWHEIQEMLDRTEARQRRVSSSRRAPKTTQMLDLNQGEEVTLTSEGVWELACTSRHRSAVPDALGVVNNVPRMNRVPSPYYLSW